MIPGRRPIAPFLRFLMIFPVIAAAGCTSSREASTESTDRKSPPPAVRETTGREDSPDLPKGKYTVQIGAFKSGTSAKQVADRAEQRFARTVYTIYDGTSELFRVMLGVFDTKILARDFRDLIVTQYPEDYRDAWVSELSK